MLAVTPTPYSVNLGHDARPVLSEGFEPTLPRISTWLLYRLDYESINRITYMGSKRLIPVPTLQPRLQRCFVPIWSSGGLIWLPPSQVPCCVLKSSSSCVDGTMTIVGEDSLMIGNLLLGRLRRLPDSLPASAMAG